MERVKLSVKDVLLQKTQRVGEMTPRPLVSGRQVAGQFLNWLPLRAFYTPSTPAVPAQELHVTQMG